VAYKSEDLNYTAVEAWNLTSTEEFQKITMINFETYIWISTLKRKIKIMQQKHFPTMQFLTVNVQNNLFNKM
jgi:hypothetical protein